MAWACLAVAAGIGAVLVTTWNPPPEERFRTAVAAMDAGDMQAGLLADLRSAQRAYPHDPKPFAREASLSAYLFRTTRDKEYLEGAQRAVDHAMRLGNDPFVFAACIHVGLAARDLGMARRCADEIAARAPKDYPGVRSQIAELARGTPLLEEPVTGYQLVSRAYTELQQGRIEAAEALLTRSLADGSELAWPYLAQIELVYGDPAIAEDFLARAMGRGPAHAHHVLNFAVALILQGDLDEAAEELELAGKLDDADPSMIHLNTGDLESLRGNTEGAATAYAAAVQGWETTAMSPNQRALLAYAMARSHGDPAAVGLALEAVSENPTSAVVAWSAWQVGEALDHDELKNMKQRAEALGISPWWIELGEALQGGT